ncbi:MAG: GNAT family N-acetyltransferase [Candidatus Eisenbacteria bacterium]
MIAAVVETASAHARLPSGAEEAEVRSLLLDLLEAGRTPAFLRRIAGTPLADRWLEAVLGALDAAAISLGDLLQQRAARTPDRTWIRVPRANGWDDVTWGEAEERVAAIARGLREELPERPGAVHVAILAPNRLETILADVACLTHGIVDVPISSDSTPDQVRFILEQTAPPILLVSDRARLDAVLSAGPLPAVRTVLLMDEPEGDPPVEHWLLLREIEERGRSLGRLPLPRIAPRALATLLYTSGTTGQPKGIRFSQRNIVYKRFCRAVAIPEIGEDDTFLCYLPLFHTFGRWLEMTGTLFWGATYAMMENPSVETMLARMALARPTVFISIPKRWIQLHERIIQVAGGTMEEREEIPAARLDDATEAVTGGRLRWGLSAAGHLDTEVFLFFQKRGIELLSGFGMTEATGGITMTPPGQYRRGTVGKALPGIEVRRAEDGELLVRGPYLMLGYNDPDAGDRDYEADWFATGDIVREDEDGYYTIVDRKKDIYKNVKGQTIAPQRIENLFDEFEEVKRSFLVGDGREYNTLLLYPDYEAAGGKLKRMSAEDLREYLSSFVVSVNRFLAPYERVVAFDLLPRYFREDRGELTPKGTFVRKVVEKSFSELIESLYARPYVTVTTQGIDVRVPSWLLREKGLTPDSVSAEPGGIRLRPGGERLTIARIPGAPGRYRVGTFTYRMESEERAAAPLAAPLVDLDRILAIASLWAGNLELSRFVGEGRPRRPRTAQGGGPRISIEGWHRPTLLVDFARETLGRARAKGATGAALVHALAGALFATQGSDALDALASLRKLLQDPAAEEAALARAILPLLRTHPDAAVRSAALAILLPGEVDERAAETLASFLEVDADVFSPEVRARALEHEITPAALRSILRLGASLEVPAGQPWAAGPARRRIESILRFCVETAEQLPRWYAIVRQLLAGRSMQERDADVRALALSLRERLDERFRSWIEWGRTSPTDPETGKPIGWDRVLGFDERVEPEVRERLRDALAETTLLRESIFLLADGTLLSGGDLLPGGIWVSHLGAGHGKTVVRLIVSTRGGRTHEFVVKILREIRPEEAREEADWLIRLGSFDRAVRLVADFGGYWPERGIWSEEYISGETVRNNLTRIAAHPDEERRQRLSSSWPHVAWSALATFVEFWQRTGRKLILAEPTPENIVVAPHDYQEGSRLVSITSRLPFQGIASMLRRQHETFLDPVHAQFPELASGAPRRTSFSAFLEAVGETTGLALLWRALGEMKEKLLAGDPSWQPWSDDLRAFLDEVEQEGFAPRRLVMAVRRYHLWAGLNAGASLQARAMTLQEVYETYGLPELEKTRPEMRIRFFRRTVFAGARAPLARELDALIRAHRDTPLKLEALLRRMAILHRSIQLDDEEAYFLARMTYAHLDVLQDAHLELLEEGGEIRAELVEEFRDETGDLLRIRPAASPKELIRLHHLFEQSGLSVVFRPEHRFLVAVDEQDLTVGGLFYRPAVPGVVHMEKIVVGPRRRGKGLGERLMRSFLQRLRDTGQRRVTTGFFRPHFFYQFGFRLERGFAGLVKDLEEES